MAIRFQAEKLQIIADAKKEAKDREKEKRARFQSKIEQIKRMEIEDFKKSYLQQSQVNKSFYKPFESQLATAAVANGAKSQMILADLEPLSASQQPNV